MCIGTDCQWSCIKLSKGALVDWIQLLIQREPVDRLFSKDSFRLPKQSQHRHCWGGALQPRITIGQQPLKTAIPTEDILVTEIFGIDKMDLEASAELKRKHEGSRGVQVDPTPTEL